MLATEVLHPEFFVSKQSQMIQDKGQMLAYPTDDVFMIRKVRFATLAAVNSVTVQVGVVGQPHCEYLHAGSLNVWRGS